MEEDREIAEPKRDLPPDEKILVNIAEKIPEDVQKDITETICTDYDIDLKSRTDWEEKRDRWYRLWTCVREEKTDPWPGCSNICFSLDTEILTIKGWKLIGDVAKGEFVYTRDYNGNAFYKPVSSTTFENSNSLIHFRGQSVDIKVTPDHQMLVESEKTGKCSFYPARYFLENKGSGFIPLWSKYSEGQLPLEIQGINAKAFVRFLGWYISEGSNGEQKTKSGKITHGTFYIAQKDRQKRKILEQDIKKAGFKYRDVSGKGYSVHARSMSPYLKKALRGLGKATEKYIPRDVLQLSPKLLKELLNTLMLGDGSINERGFRYYHTSSKQLADDVQELCQKIGIRASISIGKKRINRPTHNTEYIVRLCEQHLHTQFKYIKKEVVRGEAVACVEVKPTHTIYVRRNNKPIWCGNCIPMLATAANQFHARAYQAIFAPPGMVKTLPVAENDIKRAKNVQDFLNWQILYEMEEYEDVFDRLLQILPINGIHFKKNWWSQDRQSPMTEHISPLDIVLPYNTKTLETARRLVHRLWLYREELQERADKELYINIDALPENNAATENDSDVKQSSDEVEGIEKSFEDENPRLILECHRKWKFSDGLKPYIFTVDYDTKTLLRAVSRTFETGAEKKVLNYFTDYHFLPNPEGFYSFGFGHFLEQLNEMANTAFNQIFDAGRLTNQPFGFYGRRSGIKRKEIILKPGHMEQVEDAKQVYFPTMQRVDQVLFMVLGLIQQYTEQFTTVTELISGRQQKGVREPTASGTRDVIQQGLVTFAVMTKRIFRSLRKELRLLMLLNQIYLPDRKEYRVMGDESKIAFPDIKKEDLDGVKDVIPIGDPAYADRFSLRQEAVTLYQLGMSNPFIVGNPQAGIPPQPKIIYHLWEDVVEQFEKKNKSQLVPEMPEESITPEMENAKIMQGEYTEPKSGENHDMHIQVHVAFEQGPYWETIPDEYKMLHVKHGKATMAMKMHDEAIMKKLGAQQNVRQ